MKETVAVNEASAAKINKADVLALGVAGIAIEKIVSESSNTVATKDLKLDTNDVVSIVLCCVAFVGVMSASALVYKISKNNKNKVKEGNGLNESENSENITDEPVVFPRIPENPIDVIENDRKQAVELIC